ncbi:MAG TPA: SpoIIE family protein phosphatase [Bacteroidia bacterium]|jgi:anti-sigma regulatory factor (Ser/Thr protein kinase)|nr:SpoIIE family protein phosphatase [Bacteroidia bacterium]
MDNILFHRYLIEERSYVSFIKREIHNLVKPVFNERRTGEVDIVVSEMCSNLIKYARKGELLYRLSKEDDQPVFEVICLDNGPGIKDINFFIKDGVSSRNSLGQGLGSIMRLSNFAQIYSKPDMGTIVYSKFYNDPEYIVPKNKLLVRSINIAKPGESVSGDGLKARLLGNYSLFLIGDGLGHGPQAKEAIDRAISVFDETMSDDPAVIIREINAGVKKTRGLVGTVVVLNHETKKGSMCGVGNISSRIQQGLVSKNYTPNNGIIGMNIPTRIENFSFDLEKMQQLIFCSDGIRTKWDLIKYSGILKYDPMMLAAVLYKDNARLTDDMTILIIKTA